MDLVEIYLINTLNPKYNKKDSRNDGFVSLKLDELNWLQFDMCEIEQTNEITEIKHSKNKIIENFVKENIKVGMYITTNYKEIIDVECCSGTYGVDSKFLLQKIDKINVNNCKLKTEFGHIYDFKNIYLYDLTDRRFINGICYNYFNHIHKNFEYINNDIKNLKIMHYDLDEVVICEYSDEQYEWDDLI